jgi:MYXO-CTERM domain-containing protein
LREPTGPLPSAEPVTADEWPWMVGLLGLALIVAAWWARRRRHIVTASPAEAARSALAQLVDRPPAEAAERLDRVVRVYLEATRGWPASRMTAPELAAALTNDGESGWRSIVDELCTARFAGGAIPTDRTTDLTRRTHAAIQADSGDASDGGAG